MQEMCWGTLGTVRPFTSFNPDKDAVEIQTALERKGNPADGVHLMWVFNPLSIILSIETHCVPRSDAVTLVRILTNRSNAQRQVIAKTFQARTQKVKQQKDQFTPELFIELYSTFSALTSIKKNPESSEFQYVTK